MKSFLRSTWRYSIVIMAASFLFLAAHVVFAVPPSHACDLPQSLQREIAAKYPGGSVVGLQDLTSDDVRFFKHDHGNTCPGLTKVDFYGDGKPTLAVALFFPAKKNSQLIVAHEPGTGWNIQLIDTADASPVPVVWSQPPGKYVDIDNGKTIRASKPVIVFCGYEGWAIVYSWTGSKVDKVWIMD